MAETEPLVLVADVHELFASSLAIALRHAGFSRVDTADPDALAREGSDVAVAPGDIVLLGLLYGDGRTALSVIGTLAGRGARVLVMAPAQGLPLAGDCLARGAETVVDQGMSFDHLVAVLQRLCAGGQALTDEERAALLDAVEQHEAAERALQKPFEALTGREAEVFAALVDGAAPKQIARVKGITIYTVRGHIQRVLSKLDVSSQREALAMARNAGWP